VGRQQHNAARRQVGHPDVFRHTLAVSAMDSRSRPVGPVLLDETHGYASFILLVNRPIQAVCLVVWGLEIKPLVTRTASRNHANNKRMGTMLETTKPCFA
jgi:hypothetical protein